MDDFAQKIWVKVDGEKFLVEIEDIHQRPIIAIVEGTRFEISVEDVLTDSETSDSTVASPSHDLSNQSMAAGTVTEVTSPMPGDIIQILVDPGQVVHAGDPVCVLDAMKMKNTIHAPHAGTITKIFVQEGQSVEYGTDLFRIN